MPRRQKSLGLSIKIWLYESLVTNINWFRGKMSRVTALHINVEKTNSMKNCRAEFLGRATTPSPPAIGSGERCEFGIKQSTMDWFSIYLSDRTRTFCANAVMSRPIPVTCSVPQGSVLDQVLFISYTDDVTLIFDSHQVMQSSSICWWQAGLHERTCQ